MKVVILAGGLGTRLAEETEVKPKPMVALGDKPILWHIMKIYGAYGFNEFVICLGYKGFVIKEFFANYALHTSDVTLDMAAGTLQVHRATTEPWKVTLVDTGDQTMTAGRILRVRDHIGDEPFMVTYGDGVGDIDVAALVDFHRESGKLATVTAVQPPGRFGAMAIAEDGTVSSFQEKPAGDSNWINGGFFVFEPSVFDYLGGDEVMLETDPMERLAADGELSAYRHDGFWQPMDTMRDKRYLNDLWESGSAPWRVW